MTTCILLLDIAIFCAFKGVEDAVYERLGGHDLQPLAAREDVGHEVIGGSKPDFIVGVAIAVRQVTLSRMHRQVAHIILLCSVGSEHDPLQRLFKTERHAKTFIKVGRGIKLLVNAEFSLTHRGFNNAIEPKYTKLPCVGISSQQKPSAMIEFNTIGLDFILLDFLAVIFPVFEARFP